MSPRPPRITKLLQAWRRGDSGALDQLVPAVYDELQEQARRHLRRERPDHTLETPALVHEAYLRLVDQTNTDWQNRTHFFGVAAQIMRRVLVDYARKKQAVKRGGRSARVTLSDATTAGPERDVDLLELDEALSRLAEVDPQQCRIVELRYFTGLSIEETAEVLGISPATVKRGWAAARAWLRHQLTPT